MSSTAYDVIVIGAGPGGYVAAIRASQLGLRAAVVEREHLGGVCLNWGCIPAKTLLRCAEVLLAVRDAESYGVMATGARPNLGKMVSRSRDVAAQLAEGIRGLLHRKGVDVIAGEGRIEAPGCVAVRPTAAPDDEVLHRARDIIVATGARARELPGVESDGERIWTYRHALVPDEVPERLLVVGAGAIGMEFASFFNALGSRVTVLETQDRVLPGEDVEISKALEVAVDTRGVRCLTSATLDGATRERDGLRCTVRGSGGSSETLVVDRLIVAAGIIGNVENLGLEAVGVATEHGHVVVNDDCATRIPGIWAIGDVAGPPWLAHKASHEGIMVAERIAGQPGRHSPVADVPRCTYSQPQVASIGLTEDDARAHGYRVKVGRFPLRANGRALTHGDTEGLVKTVFDAGSGEFLGAHLIGTEVTELVQGFSVARTLESTELELMNTIFPHPTISEAMHESVLQAYGRALHI